MERRTQNSIIVTPVTRTARNKACASGHGMHSAKKNCHCHLMPEKKRDTSFPQPNHFTFEVCDELSATYTARSNVIRPARSACIIYNEWEGEKWDLKGKMETLRSTPTRC